MGIGTGMKRGAGEEVGWGGVYGGGVKGAGRRCEMACMIGPG